MFLSPLMGLSRELRPLSLWGFQYDIQNPTDCADGRPFIDYSHLLPLLISNVMERPTCALKHWTEVYFTFRKWYYHTVRNDRMGRGNTVQNGFCWIRMFWNVTRLLQAVQIHSGISVKKRSSWLILIFAFVSSGLKKLLCVSKYKSSHNQVCVFSLSHSLPLMVWSCFFSVRHDRKDKDY